MGDEAMVMRRKVVVQGTSGWRRFLPPMSRPSPGAYIWLSYGVFFFFEPIFRHDTRYWMKCWAVFAVFLVLYVGMDVLESLRARLVIIGLLVGLGMATLPLNPGSSTFFLYASSFLPFMVPSIPVVTSFILVDFVLLVGEGYLLGYHWLDYTIPAFFLLAGGGTNLFIARQKRMNVKLEMAHEEIEQLAALAERERIARDLHDVLGHTLSVIVLKAELAGRLMERDPRRAAAEIAEVESTARSALAEVREAIGGYRAKGLGAELESARRTLDAAGVTLVCEADAIAGGKTLRATEETVLSLVVREAVTNIVRHAAATRCRMRLATTADGFHSLLVEDDGRSVVLREGNGLRGMRERVEALGGRFSVRNVGGTALLVELPVTVGRATLEAATLDRAPLDRASLDRAPLERAGLDRAALGQELGEG